jgi:hypothetical protein
VDLSKLCYKGQDILNEESKKVYCISFATLVDGLIGGARRAGAIRA